MCIANWLCGRHASLVTFVTENNVQVTQAVGSSSTFQFVYSQPITNEDTFQFTYSQPITNEDTFQFTYSRPITNEDTFQFVYSQPITNEDRHGDAGPRASQTTTPRNSSLHASPTRRSCQSTNSKNSVRFLPRLPLAPPPPLSCPIANLLWSTVHRQHLAHTCTTCPRCALVEPAQARCPHWPSPSARCHDITATAAVAGCTL